MVAGRLLALLALLAPPPGTLPPVPPGPKIEPGDHCAQLRTRIAQRRRFLQIREGERLRFPTDPTFSPYCESHPGDQDCSLPTQFPESEDASRDVSELSSVDGGVPETDPVLVPLLRQLRALGCVGRR